MLNVFVCYMLLFHVFEAFSLGRAVLYTVKTLAKPLVKNLAKNLINSLHGLFGPFKGVNRGVKPFR